MLVAAKEIHVQLSLVLGLFIPLHADHILTLTINACSLWPGYIEWGTPKAAIFSISGPHPLEL